MSTTDETGDSRARQDQDTLTDRLNELFVSVTYTDKRGRSREYSTPHVARAISEDPEHDTTISRVYLATLRSGSNTNPTVAVLRAITKFFNDRREPGTPLITPAFLLGEQEDAEEQELRRKLADRQVRTIAMRAGSMSPTVRRQVLQMLDVLDTDPDDSGRTP